MKSLVLLVLLVFLLPTIQSSSSKSGISATIQNRDTVRSLYGSPVSKVYRTSQDLTITASFASNGNLCRAHVKSDLDPGITDAQLKVVLDELAPEEARGEYKIGTFLNGVCLKYVEPEKSKPHSKRQLVADPCAECSGVSEDYERVNITKYGNTNEYSSVYISFQQPECKELDKVRH